MLAVRASRLVDVGGFDEDLRVGEDVDLVWRLVAAGGLVRYEPAAVARHRNRPTWPALARQRHAYGTAAAQLDRRHPGDLAPIEMAPATFATWVLAAFGGRAGGLAALGLALRGAFRLFARLDGRVAEPAANTLRLSARGHAHAAKWLAAAVARAWLPVAVAGMTSRRVRRALVAVVVVRPAIEWARRRPDLNPLTYAAARALDDAAYCSGLWLGAARARNPRPLLPRLRARS